MPVITLLAFEAAGSGRSWGSYLTTPIGVAALHVAVPLSRPGRDGFCLLPFFRLKSLWNIFLFACILSLIGAIQFPVPSAREFIA